MIGRSFQNLSKSASIHFYGDLVRPHLEYGIPACLPNFVADIIHLERIQILGTRLVTDMRHLPYEERLQQLGLHSLQRRRLQANLITALKIFTGLLDIDQNLFFLPSARRGLRGHNYKVLQGASPAEGESCEVLELAPGFSQCFQETVGESLDRSHSSSPPLT